MGLSINNKLQYAIRTCRGLEFKSPATRWPEEFSCTLPREKIRLTHDEALQTKVNKAAAI